VWVGATPIVLPVPSATVSLPVPVAGVAAGQAARVPTKVGAYQIRSGPAHRDCAKATPTLGSPCRTNLSPISPASD
jgi:hypothetical protein